MCGPVPWKSIEVQYVCENVLCKCIVDTLAAKVCEGEWVREIYISVFGGKVVQAVRLAA